MTRTALLCTVLATLLSVATAQPVWSDHPAIQAKFSLLTGGLIELDTKAKTLVTPRSRDTRLEDCSDKLQVCLTDHHGFSFSYFRKCRDAGLGDYSLLKFPPKVVSRLHNDAWFVFDASPHYLFHYAYGRGIVGIYLAQAATYDFRRVLRDHNFRVSDLDAMEYLRTPSSDAVAACSN